MEVGFQTEEKNEAATAKLMAAREALEAAKDAFYMKLREVYPIGAHVRICVAARKHSNFEVIEHLGEISPYMKLRNRRTGAEKRLDMGDYGIDLETYAYTLVDRATQMTVAEVG